ncbi:MAG: serine/threonine protein kinase, partial [Candidatus Eisenbacteria bacterium]|nr:serine/threonine protein kinase [Candidatus Eisenbacteria bacterium]
MSDNFTEVRKHFEIAFDLEGDARSQYMAQLERDHPEIAKAVRSLIEADSQASSFLGGTAFDDINTQDWIGKKVASFTIVDVLAEGGMGIVFRASQENPKRSVALKLIRNELSSQQALRRFELEAEVLGRLDHPGIARIYEAGQTTKAAGQRPYLVMELIDGVPLDDYLNREQLSVEAKVTLLTQICAAVQHAHEHGIIHRDLKPSNILVTPQGQPKIVDFGVARVTDDDLRATMQTDMGQVIGTLPYMSPEQVHGRRDDLDTRSDVYALGVVAYEMITGSLPYD